MWRTIGHEKAVSILDRSLREERLAHGYLLFGPSNIGKTTLAVELAQAVNCLGSDRPCGQCTQCTRIAQGKHADVQMISTDAAPSDRRGRARTEIGIDQIREMQRAAALKPFEGRCRVFVIEGVERLSDEAANSLLKTLEEPPNEVMLILTTDREPDELPQTIVSRCQIVGMRPLPTSSVTKHLEERWEVGPARAEEMARLSRGRIGWAINAVENPDLLEPREQRLEALLEMLGAELYERFSYAAKLASLFSRDREAVREEMELWLSLTRDMLVLKEGSRQLVVNLSVLDELHEMSAGVSSASLLEATKAVDDTWKRLTQNANPRLSLEVLMLNLPAFRRKRDAR